jgi:hypothetical protein
MTSRARGLIFVGLMSACSAPPTTINIYNYNPDAGPGPGPGSDAGTATGVVGGLVLSASDQSPVAGATVTLVSGGTTSTATTGMDGAFSFAGVPFGTFIVEVSANGTLSAVMTGVVLAAAPTATLGPIGLVPNTGTFAVRVVDEQGAAAPGIKVTGTTDVRWVSFAGGDPSAQGSVTVTATSDASGLVKFTGLPDLTALGTFVGGVLTVAVPPVKIMGTETYDFLGVTLTYNLRALGVTMQAPTVTLAGPHTPLAAVASNITYLVFQAVFETFDGLTIPAAGPITVTFNQAVDPPSVRAVINLEDGVTPAPVQPQATVTGNVVTLSFATPLAAGARFNLDLHAIAARATSVNDVQAELNVQSAPFFTEPASGTPASVVGTSVTKTIDTSNNVVVTFRTSEPIGLGRGVTNPISCIAFYENVNLDNGDPASYPGEYNNGGQSLTCWAQGVPLPPMDITAIRPIEQAPVITGFATKWSVIVDNVTAGFQGPCKSLGIACTRPSAGTKIHLVFDRLPPAQTVRRTSGAVVATDPTNLVLTIP